MLPAAPLDQLLAGVASLAAAGAMDHLPTVYLPLLLAAICGALAICAKDLADSPLGAGLAKSMGGGAAAGVMAVAFGLAAAGLGFFGWKGMAPGASSEQPTAYLKALDLSGLLAGPEGEKVADALRRGMTPEVEAIFNQEAELYLSTDGQMGLDTLHGSIRDRMLSEERAGRLPAGSYASWMPPLVGQVVGEKLGVSNGGWRGKLDAMLASDGYDYRRGRNREVFAGARRQPSAAWAPANGAVDGLPYEPSAPTGNAAWDAVKDRVFPVMASDANLAKGPREGIDVPNEGVFKSFGAGMSYYYAQFDGTRLTPVRRAEFASYGVAADAFAKQALENLGKYFDAGQGFDVSPLANGAKVATLSGPTVGFAGSYILLPDLGKRLGGKLKAPMLLVAPTESTLMAGELGAPGAGGAEVYNAEFARTAEASAQGAAASDPDHALPAKIVLLLSDGVVAFQTDPAGLPDGVVPTGL